METQPLTIWCNSQLDPAAMELLKQSTTHHRLICSTDVPPATVGPIAIALGQPPADWIRSNPQLRWAHIASAGYTAYDNDEMREVVRERGLLFTNSSHIYDEPCAQHVLAMMLSHSRQLLPSYWTQLGSRAWEMHPRRKASFLLLGQTVVLLGFGAIAQRLVAMLAPFQMRIIAIRRHPAPVEGVEVVGEDELPRVLPLADHVVNTLPASPSTDGFFNAARFRAMKPGAVFYNIGRGTTIDQADLLDALRQGPLAAAYLDVTDPEPLPPAHPLWEQPNCFITPHVGGGHQGEYERLTRHFLDNLKRFEKGEALVDRILGS